jgi:hypothetical protein
MREGGGCTLGDCMRQGTTISSTRPTRALARPNLLVTRLNNLHTLSSNLTLRHIQIRLSFLLLHLAHLCHHRVRQKCDINDRLSASAGLYYDLSSSSLGPWGTLTYKLEPSNPKSKSRIGASLPRFWEFSAGVSQI